MSARGSIEGLPWAHWKGSLQDDKASISLQLSSKVKCSLNLIAPEKERHLLALAAKEDSTSFCSCGFQWKLCQRLAERLQRQPKGCSVADMGLRSVRVCCIRRSAFHGLNFNIVQVWQTVRLLHFGISVNVARGKWAFYVCVCVTAEIGYSSQIKKSETKTTVNYSFISFSGFPWLPRIGITSETKC